MSRKIKKKQTAPTVQVPEEKPHKFLKFMNKNAKVMIISATAILLIVAFVVGLIAFLPEKRTFNYLKDDLSVYISMSDNDYKNYSVVIKPDEIDDADVQREINRLLYNNKGSVIGNGVYYLKAPVSLGDTVVIYYRGYTLDKDGNKVDFAGGTNFSQRFDESSLSLNIGSGSFISGFEEGLIGKVPNAVEKGDGKNFEVLDSGTVEENMIIYVTGKVLNPNGTSESFSQKRIELSSDNIDSEWGTGFKDFLLGKSDDAQIKASKKIYIGSIQDTKTFAYDDGSKVYYDFKVEYALNTTAEPIVVETFFPIDYSEESLRGVTAYFDVYLFKTMKYEMPEYNEKFITETLKISEDDLDDYEGETIIEKHKAMIREQLEQELEETKNSLIEEAMWEQYFKYANIKKLPEAAVNEQYDIYYNQLSYSYQNSSSSYSTLDEYAKAVYGLSETDDWREYLKSNAESVVKEKLIFYYVTRKENIDPSPEQLKSYYDDLVDEHISEYIEENGYEDELEKITDKAKKDARISEIKNEMIEEYGDEYFSENARYNYALEKLLGFAKITDGTAENK